MKRVALGAIRIYQHIFSDGIIAALFPGSHCRFTPTCSQYTYQAVARYGTIKGLFLGLRRILHCHPWSRGGYDPVR